MIFEYHIGDTQLYTSCIIDCLLLLQSIVFSVTMDCLMRDNGLSYAWQWIVQVCTKS